LLPYDTATEKVIGRVTGLQWAATCPQQAKGRGTAIGLQQESSRGVGYLRGNVSNPGEAFEEAL